MVDDLKPIFVLDLKGISARTPYTDKESSLTWTEVDEYRAQILKDQNANS